MALMFVLLALSAFVAHELWNWFVVPLGVRRISTSHAYGLMTLVWLATNGTKNLTSKADDTSVWAATLGTVLGLGAAWAIGAAIVALDPSL